MSGRLRRRLLLVALAIVLILTAGTVGFVAIEGYSWFDAFYMSLITITTVGYAEIQPLSRAGRIFNSVLLLFGVATMVSVLGVMTQTIIELELGEVFGKRRVKRMIENLKDHYIVCGFGRVGRAAAQELRRSGVPFVIVDQNPAIVEAAIKHGMLAVAADAKSNETLRDIGIAHAKGLIGALETDADNLFLILSAKELNSSLIVASRVNEEEAESKLRRAGADAIFRPYNITGYRLAQAILRPFVFEFLDLTSSTVDLGQNIGIEQILVPPDSNLASKSLMDLQLRRDLDIIVLAIRKADGKMHFNPPASAVIEGDDYLVVMGNVQDLQRLDQRMKG